MLEFYVYYGRKSNFYRKRPLNERKKLNTTTSVYQDCKIKAACRKCLLDIRKEAAKATERCNNMSLKKTGESNLRRYIRLAEKKEIYQRRI